MNDRDKVLTALLSPNEEKPPDVTGVTCEQLNNELQAQQARIEKAFKAEIEKLTKKLQEKESEEKNNGKEDFRDKQGIDESREVPVDGEPGNESN